MKKLILLLTTIICFVTFSNAQIISTIAGNGSQGYSGDGGAATSAELYHPAGLGLDTAGNVYIADYDNNVVRKITVSTGNITTVAGNGTAGFSGDGGPATSAELWGLYGVCVDKAGDIYIADGLNERIRKVDHSTGNIYTVAGNGTAGFSGDGGPATSAELNAPTRVALDESGNIYIVDASNNRIRKITMSTGFISTVAGNGTSGFSGDGGSATSAELFQPHGIVLDASGNIYIADNNNNRIRKVNSSGTISTIAGNGTSGYTGDGGLATSAELNSPCGVSLDNSGNVYIADGNNVIRKIIASTGIISTIAGDGTAGFFGDGGMATSAELDFTTDITLDSLSNFYIADQFNQRIRKVTVPVLAINIASQNNVPCNGGTGKATANAATGGLLPYTYAWTPSGGTNLTASNLSSGTYTITVTDANSSTATAFVTITQPNPLGITIGSQTNTNECSSIGSASANAATGGTIPYTYSWTPSGGTNLTASNLSAGTYIITATDANLCSATASVTITTPPALSVTSDSVNVNSTGACNGQATANVSGGTAPYTYKWSPGGGTNDTINGKCSGHYCCLVTDHNGCKDSSCVTIVNVTGIENIWIASSIISVFPNPANTEITFQMTSQNQAGEIIIFDLTGRIIQKDPIIQNKTVLSLAGYMDGVYVYQVSDKAGNVLGRGKFCVAK